MNKLLDWILGGANFEIKRKGKVGEIIPPAYNGTNGWFKQSRWDLVTKIDNRGHVICVSFIWDYPTVRAIELIQKLNKQEKQNDI